jgi:glycine/sarcosine/betaine reductase complex component C subunit beta
MPRPAVAHAALVLEHVPDLVRYGSKPQREPGKQAELQAALRGYEAAASYGPNQAVIGNIDPEDLWSTERPWWKTQLDCPATGPFGEVTTQEDFYARLVAVDQFDLVRMGDEPVPGAGDLPLFRGTDVVGAFGSAHEVDESLQASVLLENLACKASAAHAVEFLLAKEGVDPESIRFVISAGEEAIGDRYQRGGGNLAKAVAEQCGLTNASGCDVKAFCAGPIHALIMAAALVASGTHDNVVVCAGGSLAKLGMKFLGALEHGVPVLEDVLAGMAVLVTSADAPTTIRLDAIGQHATRSGSSQQLLLEDILSKPLDALGLSILDVDRYATELHNPEITQPAGGGDVPERNYRMLAGIGVIRGELTKDDIASFDRERGLPGFSPTQGHIASSIPWLPHALSRFRAGTLHRTMLLAKGSLFLGRMTRLWDGASIVLEG